MAVISWNNYLDTSTISNNSALESPVNSTEVLSTDKLKTRQIGDVFRQSFSSVTSPLDSLLLDFDLGSAKATDLFCVLNHTMGGYSYTLSFGTSQGDDSVGSVSGTFWEGTEHDAPNELLYFSTSYTARYIRLAVAIPAAVSVDIGRIWIDSAWTTGFNVSMDFGLGIVDRSTTTKSRGGSTYASARQILRRMDVRAIGRSTDAFIGDSADTDMKSFLTLDLAVGTHGECICLPMTASKHEIQRTSIYGVITKNNPIRIKDKGGDGYLSEKSFTVEEDRG